MWKEGLHTNDYKFADRLISETFTIGATGILLHKYLGPIQQTGSTNATMPNFTNQSEKNIQDLLFLENRDRKYDTSVYGLRGHYTVADGGFDLSQFGLFLQTGTLFMTFHINDIVKIIGRKIINGDVLELVHLKDFNSLDTSTPAALKRFYVCSDASNGANGYGPSWWPHLWRVKLNPLTDSQEYKDILKNMPATDATDAGGNPITTPINDILSSINLYQGINDAIITQAERDVPRSGYNTQGIFIKAGRLPNEAQTTPDDKVHGYMTGDGLPPNETAVAAGLSFPPGPLDGDYYLRLDYVPNRLFRYDGNNWKKIEDAVRTNLTNGAADNATLRDSFVTDTSTFVTSGGNVRPTLQGLSSILAPSADNQ